MAPAADITRVLSDKGFNILSGYLGPSEVKGRGRTELVVRCDGLSGSTSAEIKRELEATLAASGSLGDLGLSVGYPQGYAEGWDPKPDFFRDGR